ncbi:hypothetical protein H2200_007148 [Cladophialophora chaetospira]|uniref:Uncharacterized protein n=1 Tax=Cladophialophora chaetospira TaxID=386627 RepID=A0AA38X794_9EURO|nr:hypothetical protein H2200_007148 [Cladophialophora chaetospira]
MSLADSSTGLDAPASPTRPSSSWTSNSLFADSAISVQTPAPLQKESYGFEADEAPGEPAIADRLNGLVSEIWACEQDGGFREDKRRKIAKAVEEIEAALEDDSLSDEESDAEVSYPTEAARGPEPNVPAISEDDLDSIRTSLAATVGSMRMRQQEQRHLHQLTVEKLEAVAQKCIQQERQLREFAARIAGLNEDNRTLQEENQVLHVQVADAEAKCAQKEIAIKAMSSAVTGLEGYVKSSPSPVRSAGSRRVVTRGRGRFRGRYYVDEPVESPVGYGLDNESDGQALHEGVAAWVKGFRDVEEELISSQGTSTPADGRQTPPKLVEDEWGDFQTVSGR